MKTAEEIFNEHSWSSLGAISPSKNFCLPAMREFAAQEVEAYKERLKKAIHGYYLNSFREKEFCGIIDEIDTTK